MSSPEAEQGLLLLSCTLPGDKERPMTQAQLRQLGRQVRAAASALAGSGRPVTEQTLEALGCSRQESRQILALLDRQEALRQYLSRGDALGIQMVSRLSDAYPARLREKLGEASPAALFYLGDPALWNRPSLAVVGSRKIRQENGAFARKLGRLAAETGYVLVSGGAEGADSLALNACLEAGGCGICVLPDSLERRKGEFPVTDRLLLCSADGYDLPFSTARAYGRNRLIHCLGERTVAVQTGWKAGGTWAGCEENLRRGFSPVFCYQDGSPGAVELIQRGAWPVEAEIKSLEALRPGQLSFL